MITKEQAQDMLASIERTEQRSAQYFNLAQYGRYAQLWGAILVVGHAICFFWPGNEPMVLVSCDIVTALLMPLLRRFDVSPQRRTDRRLWAAAAIVIAFGALASYLIGPDLRAIEVLWTCMIMGAIMLRGLLTGTRWIVLGGVCCATSVLAYLYLGLWYHVALAAALGGGLLLAGTWLRGAR
jgi:hypothetical protein